MLLPLGISRRDDFCQLAGALNRRLISCRNDCGGDAASEPLLSELLQYFSKLSFIHVGQPGRSRLSRVGIHPHIQRSVMRETETPLGVIELR